MAIWIALSMDGCELVVQGSVTRIFKLTTDPNDCSPSLSWDEIESLSSNPLFAGKSWKWSDRPWALTDEVLQFLADLGNAGLSFFRALERLYLKSADDQKILRNRDVRAPWVAQYLDAGKPDWLVRHARSKNVLGALPPVLRPDLLPTRDGFALTEWDSVPGGIGLTDQIGRFYLKDDAPAIAQAFGEALVLQAGELGRSAQFAILVSEESATYRPEMEWLAEELKSSGLKVLVGNPNEVSFSGDYTYLEGIQLNVIYRFWELFDPEVPQMPAFARCVEAGNLVVTPGMRPFLEEKLSLALLHHPRLEEYWRENLSKQEREILSRAVPESWIVDPAPVPPGALIDGPLVGGKSLGDWMDLAEASQRERSLVLKASGFHETAWGARSVVVGEDVSTEEWTAALSDALQMFPNPLSILQQFRKPVSMEHPVYNDNGELGDMKGRLRLSPYYFATEVGISLCGALATFCPADKKIIHGMRDGALLPCKTGG
jgi:hypothetical protein